METIQALLTNERYHSLLSEKDLSGHTPFIHACKEGQDDAVAQLLLLAEERLEVDDFNKGFEGACGGGSLPVVNRLLELSEERLEGIDFNKRFGTACYFGRLTVVNRLLEVAISHKIDIQLGLREAERGRQPDTIAAIQQWMAQRE